MTRFISVTIRERARDRELRSFKEHVIRLARFTGNQEVLLSISSLSIGRRNEYSRAISGPRTGSAAVARTSSRSLATSVLVLHRGCGNI
jgi:hypothetical protein